MQGYLLNCFLTHCIELPRPEISAILYLLKLPSVSSSSFNFFTLCINRSASLNQVWEPETERQADSQRSTQSHLVSSSSTSIKKWQYSSENGFYKLHAAVSSVSTTKPVWQPFPHLYDHLWGKKLPLRLLVKPNAHRPIWCIKFKSKEYSAALYPSCAEAVYQMQCFAVVWSLCVPHTPLLIPVAFTH